MAELIYKMGGFGTIRGQLVDGEPLLLLADVCRNLGLDDTWATGRAIAEEVTAKPALITIPTVTQAGTRADGTPYQQVKDAYWLTEVGFYLAIMRSRKPEARKFVVWVCEKVLPALRKGEQLTEEDLKPIRELYTPEQYIGPSGEIYWNREDWKDAWAEFNHGTRD